MIYFFPVSVRIKKWDFQDGKNFPPSSHRTPFCVCGKVFLFSSHKRDLTFFYKIFFPFFSKKKKEINIVLFLFRLVGNLLHHCCCYVPTVHLQPFNFHQLAPARPTRLKIANMFPPTELATLSSIFPPPYANFCKRKKKQKKTLKQQKCAVLPRPTIITYTDGD